MFTLSLMMAQLYPGTFFISFSWFICFTKCSSYNSQSYQFMY